MPHALLANRQHVRNNSAARAAVLEMLREDHKRAKKAFHDFALLDLDSESESARRLVERTCAELTMHAVLEDEFIYPAARRVLADEELVDEAEVEHVALRRLIDTLRKMEPTDRKYCAYFAVLGEYLRSHIKEEELEIFPILHAAKIDWVTLKDSIDMRRAELQASLPEPPQLVEALGVVTEAVAFDAVPHGVPRRADVVTRA